MTVAVVQTAPWVCHWFSFLFHFGFVAGLLFSFQDSFGGSIYPKTFCELNCMSKGF